MLGPFSVLAGLGFIGVVTALIASIISGTVVLWFTVKFMVPDVDEVKWSRCFLCTIAMYVVFLVAVACLRIPIIMVNMLAFFFILYYGQVAAIEGAFEIKEGGGTVLGMFNGMNLVTLYVVYAIMVGDITKANEALVGGGGSLQMSAEIAMAAADNEMQAEMEEQEKKWQAEEDARRAETAAASLAPPPTASVAIASDEDLSVVQIFASERVEKDDFPKVLRDRLGFRVVGLHVVSKKPLKLTGMAMGLAAKDDSTGFSNCPLNNWPEPGLVYAKGSPFKLAPALSSGGLIHDGYLLNLDTNETSVLGTEQGQADEARQPPEAFKHYYVFFATRIPLRPTEWYFYMSEDMQSYQVKSLGDVTKAFAKR